jgi:hypothetical protein
MPDVRHKPSSANGTPPCVSTHLEDELSLEMARLAQSMRVGGLRQAIELDLRRAYGPA